jgi:hypothetical protein
VTGYLRVSLNFALWPIVVVMLVVVSATPAGWQEVLLAATSGVVVLLISLATLPDDAQQTWSDLKTWVGVHRTLTAFVVAVAGVAGVFLFEQVVREHVPGQSLAGSAVQLSLLLWPFSLLLYQARRFVTRAWRRVSWLLAVANALVVVLPPIVIFERIDGTVPWWQALLLLAVAPTVLFALFTVLRAHVLERAFTSRAGRLTVSERTPEADRQARERPRGGLAVASAACAIASAVLLLGSAIRVPIERRLLEGSQVAERGAVLPPVDLQNPELLTEGDRRAIIDRYSPVLRLHERERWAAYNAAIALSFVQPPPRETCPEAAARPCSAVELEKALADLPSDARPPPNARVFPGGAVYPRLVDVRDEVADIGNGANAVAKTTRWLAQYWLFYPYNDWDAESAVGSLAQRHGGDWEWIGVGLDEAGAPLFVAYSAHCAGSWRPWTDAPSVALAGRRVLVGSAPDHPASHPLAIVARGSHANYATPGAREPDWGSCRLEPVVARAMRWLTFAAAAREETPDLGTFQVPAVLTEEATQRDATRPLWWGATGETLLGRIELGKDEHGPPSPRYQRGWREPMHTIFGGEWECDAGEAACPD